MLGTSASPSTTNPPPVRRAPELAAVARGKICRCIDQTAGVIIEEQPLQQHRMGTGNGKGRENTDDCCDKQTAEHSARIFGADGADDA
ncbi:hypothetical protein ACLB1Q_04670 [Escherichia coli]